MKEEQTNYRNNLLAFVEGVKEATIYKVDYYLDTDPAFEKELVPFEFKYCLAVVFHTSVGVFHISSGQLTTEGINTFWVTSRTLQDKPNESEDVNTPVKNIEVQYGALGYACKIEIHQPNQVLTLYAAEIYDTETGRLDYRYNDEMIFAFRREDDVKIFEKLATFC